MRWLGNPLIQQSHQSEAERGIRVWGEDTPPSSIPHDGWIAFPEQYDAASFVVLLPVCEGYAVSITARSTRTSAEACCNTGPIILMRYRTSRVLFRYAACPPSLTSRTASVIAVTVT